MEIKLLYVIGNLYTGYPWGVEGEQQFGTTELHGPFSSENEANTYAHKLIEQPAQDGLPYQAVKVVRLETPQISTHIVRKDGDYEYAVQD